MRYRLKAVIKRFADLLSFVSERYFKKRQDYLRAQNDAAQISETTFGTYNDAARISETTFGT